MTGTIVFIESNTTGTGMLAFSRARELGLTPVLLTADPSRYRGLDPNTAVVVTCDTDSVTVCEGLIKDRFAHELRAVMTTSEFYLETAAQIAHLYGLKGNPPEAVRTCRNKAAARTALLAAGIPQPRFSVVGTAAQAACAARTVGCPCVVKPVADTGSFAVRLCRTPQEASDHTELIAGLGTNVRGQRTSGLALIEQYLDAPEFSVELVSSDGTVNCIGVTEKTLTGQPWFVEHRHVFPAPLGNCETREVETAARRSLEAVGITTGATHVEVKLTDRGPIVVEINARLAGGMIPELIRLATGIDPLTEQIRTFAGETPRLAAARRHVAAIQFLVADRPGRLVGVDGVDVAAALPGIREVVVTSGAGRSVRPPENAYDRLGWVIAAGQCHRDTMCALEGAFRALSVRYAEPVEMGG